MTLIVLLLLGLGTVMMTSAVEDVSLTQTVGDLWGGSVGFTGQTSGHGPPGVPFAQSVTTPAPQQFVGGAAGPAQQDAYRQAEVRAYIQSQRMMH